jgi:uncharacterized protein YegP (UPF0339 family)
MNFPRTTLFALLLLAISAMSTACATDEIGFSSANIDGRPYFELFEGHDGDYYFNLSATNHEIVLSSEGYTSRTGALSGILSVLDNAGDAANYDLREATNGQFYFNLKAQNGEVIGTSELYSSKSNAKQGIDNSIDVSGEYLGFLASRRGARFTNFEGDNGLYYFNLKAGNGEIVLQSQAYTSEAAAMNGNFAVAEAGLDASNYDIKQAKDGGYYFNLKADNGEIVGTSEVYYSKSNAKRARQDVIDVLETIELL